MRYDRVYALHTPCDLFRLYALLQYKHVIKEEIFIKWKRRWLKKVTTKKYWVHPLL